MKYNKTTLKKLEELLKAADYRIRYEKGQFQSGYCLVKQQRQIVMNKFYTTEARIQSLLDILAQVGLSEEVELSENLQKFWTELLPILAQQREQIEATKEQEEAPSEVG